MSSVAYAFDSDYVDGLRRGDPAIEAHFVSHFSPLLLRILRSKVRSADQAREIRQETFLRVLSAIRSGRGVQKPERFEIFVFGVCNNIVRECYREQSRSVSLGELEIEPAADFPNADALIAAAEARSKVRHMLSQMSDMERELLRAMFLDEQNKDEICLRLGITRSYLRVLLHRAKKQFSAQIERKRCTPPVEASSSNGQINGREDELRPGAAPLLAMAASA